MTGGTDVAVAGLGAMGSAATLALARRGVRVLGLDRFQPPHAWGSSHGSTRIIREAYYEAPGYVPLVQQAYELWDSIARESGLHLFRGTGGLMVGPPEGALVQGARRSADAHGIPVELLTPSEIRRRWPVLEAPPDAVGLLEPRAGILFPEACVQACLTLAERAGARLRFDTTLLGWDSRGGALELQTSAQAFTCDILVLALGPWLRESLAGRVLPLTVERQVSLWFETSGLPRSLMAELPVFIWEWEEGRFFYGIPDEGEGLKVARHHEGMPVSPDSVDRAVTSADEAQVRQLLARYLPQVDGPPRRGTVCLYTNTPDKHFVVGPHPEEPRIILVSPCSGHGFKFASAIGEVVADLVTGKKCRLDLAAFSPSRFGTTGAGI